MAVLLLTLEMVGQFPRWPDQIHLLRRDFSMLSTLPAMLAPPVAVVYNALRFPYDRLAGRSMKAASETIVRVLGEEARAEEEEKSGARRRKERERKRERSAQCADSGVSWAASSDEAGTSSSQPVAESVEHRDNQDKDGRRLAGRQEGLPGLATPYHSHTEIPTSLSQSPQEKMIEGTTDKGEGRYITWAKTSESVPIVAKGVRHVCAGTTIDFCPWQQA